MLDTRKRILLGLALAAAVTVLHYTGAFRILSLYAVDAAFSVRGSPPAPRDVVIVGIDNASLKELGPLPWSRRRYADAIRILQRSGAKAIAFDMWFADPARDPSEDEEFAEAARSAGNVYLAMHLAQSDANVKITRTAESLAEHLAGEGHVNVFPDPDGKLRRATWEVHTMAERFVFLPALLVARILDVDPLSIRVEDGCLRIGHLIVPVRADGEGRESFLLDPPASDFALNYIPFSDLLEEQFDSDQIRGKVTLIGQVILGGGYSDVWNTPRGRKFGVVILAGAVQQVLDGRFLREVPAWTTWVGVLLLAFLGPWLFRRGYSVLAWTAHGALFVAIWTLYFVLAAKWGVLIAPIPMSAVMLLNLGAGIALHLIETRHNLVRDERAMEILRSLGETVIAVSGMPALVTGRRPDVGDSFVLPAKTPQILMRTICQAIGAMEARLFLFRGDTTQCLSVIGADSNPIAEETIRKVNDRLREKGEGFASSMPSRDLNLPTEKCPRALLAMPLRLGEQVFGAVQFHGKRPTQASPTDAFTAADLRLVAAMVQQATIGLENAALYESMRSIFLNLTLALANAVDAKDPYTRGHSERVILFSDRLGRALGLPLREIQVLRLAAALHDIGKIAIPDQILRKPGALTDEEYAVMRTHPERGAAIVGPLEELRSIIPGIRHHHERFDGRGYPDKLSGKEIPLHARIICIADSFDAITSKRYYHEERTLKDGLAELETCAGSQFDADIVRVFIECMRAVKHPLPAAPIELIAHAQSTGE